MVKPALYPNPDDGQDICRDARDMKTHISLTLPCAVLKHYRELRAQDDLKLYYLQAFGQGPFARLLGRQARSYRTALKSVLTEVVYDPLTHY